MIPEGIAHPFDPNGAIYWKGRYHLFYIFQTVKPLPFYRGDAWAHISSHDLVHWRFCGYCSFDGKKGMPDNDDTHWAPGIIVAGDQLHMFATYKGSAAPPWGGDGVIRHYVAPLDDPIDGW